MLQKDHSIKILKLNLIVRRFEAFTLLFLAQWQSTRFMNRRIRVQIQLDYFLLLSIFFLTLINHLSFINYLPQSGGCLTVMRKQSEKLLLLSISGRYEGVESVKYQGINSPLDVKTRLTCRYTQCIQLIWAKK